MRNLSNLQKGEKLHHFNIIESGTESAIAKLCKKILNFDVKANLNYYYQKFDSFLVDDARELIELQNRKYKIGEPAIFTIDCGSINNHAQNALLKIFEECHQNTYYFLLIPQSSVLLPTLLSRAILYKNDLDETKQKTTNFDFPTLDYLRKLPIKERLDLVSKWLVDYKKDKINKSQMKNFVNQIMLEMEAEVINGEIESANKLKKISESSNYFDNNGAHLKSLLEFLVLTV